MSWRMTGLRPVRPWKLGWFSPSSVDPEAGERASEGWLGARPVCGGEDRALTDDDESACSAPGAEVDAIACLPSFRELREVFPRTTVEALPRLEVIGSLEKKLT
jgi:hypothetical protein